jgi:hypothetical protein
MEFGKLGEMKMKKAGNRKMSSRVPAFLGFRFFG